MLFPFVAIAAAFEPTIDVWLPERARGGLLGKAYPALPAGPRSTGYTISVPLDYSKPFSATFDVRYFLDDTHFDPSNASSPIFVSMGGEGTTGGARCSHLAAKHGALCVSVEHRFYGESLPKVTKGGASTANYWAGLSVEGNLADTAAVIEKLQRMYTYTSNSTSTTALQKQKKRPVVNFGGSYSGATCAWFRQRYPDVSDGCVSSSGVVNAYLDSPQFDEHIAAAIGDECASRLLAQCEGRSRLQQRDERTRAEAGAVARDVRSRWASCMLGLGLTSSAQGVRAGGGQRQCRM